MSAGPAAGQPAGRDPAERDPAERDPAERGAVLVVGSVNEDVVLQVARRPAPGETVFAAAVQRRPGGKGANQAVAAARAGARVRLLARVGDDDTGTRMTDDLRRAGVDTTLVTLVADTATGVAYITVTPDGENAIVLDPGANSSLAPGDIEGCAAEVAGAAVLLAQLEVPVAAVAAAVQRAVAAGTRPVVTLAPAQPVPDELLRGLDPLLVNEHEAGALLGDDAVDAGSAGSAAGRLLERGPRSVVITLGPAGAVLGDRDGVRRLPAPRIERVVDSTGAGDTLAGVLAAALARPGTSLADALQQAMAAAAEAVQRPGAR
ncbi:MAG: ribokinase [Streptosporangiaceae bacterium]